MALDGDAIVDHFSDIDVTEHSFVFFRDGVEKEREVMEITLDSVSKLQVWSDFQRWVLSEVMRIRRERPELRKDVNEVAVEIANRIVNNQLNAIEEKLSALIIAEFDLQMSQLFQVRSFIIQHGL